MKNISINIVNSKRDRAGNCYWAFSAFDHDTGKVANGTISGGQSNIEGAEFHLRGHWPETGEPRWAVNVAEVGIRQFEQLTKGWPYAGCAPKDILSFIQAGLGKETVNV